jgi:hypothetical protein
MASKRESTVLTETYWKELNQLVEKLGCGSWRTMLRRIASGEYSVIASDCKTEDEDDGLETTPVTKKPLVKAPEFEVHYDIERKPHYAPVEVTPMPQRSRLMDRSNAAPIGRPKL